MRMEGGREEEAAMVEESVFVCVLGDTPSNDAFWLFNPFYISFVKKNMAASL